MASCPPPEDRRLKRLAQVVAAARRQGTVLMLLSVIDGWQGHLQVRVAAPGGPPWVGIALARSEQVRDPTTGMPHTLSVLVQGVHGTVCVPVEELEALDIIASPP